jgi:Xaa-Pro aminopeptidase
MTTTAGARAERLARARKQQAERGVDALLLGPSPDLEYLTGYRPPALERLTLLVLPATGDARLVVPALEAPLARDHLGELEVEVAAWAETDDPVALVGEALAAAGVAGGRLGVGDRLWSAFLLRLQAALPTAGWTTATPVTRQLRMRKDA